MRVVVCRRVVAGTTVVATAARVVEAAAPVAARVDGGVARVVDGQAPQQPQSALVHAKAGSMHLVVKP